MNNKWAELLVVCLAVTYDPCPLAVCTDNWSEYQDLTLWIAQWQVNKGLLALCKHFLPNCYIKGLENEV